MRTISFILLERNIKKHESIWNDLTIFLHLIFQALTEFPTFVSRFTGFPRSHSTWEPFWFAWHLIYSQSGYQTNAISKNISTTQSTRLLKKDFSCQSLYLWWDPGAGIRQSVWKGYEQLSSVGVIAVLLGVHGVRGRVGDGDLQHHQPLVRQGEHLHAILISTWRERRQRGIETGNTHLLLSRRVVLIIIMNGAVR